MTGTPAPVPAAHRALTPSLLLSAAVTVVFLGGAEALSCRFEKPPHPIEASDRVADWGQEWGTDFYVIRSDSAGWPPADEFNREGVRDRARTEEKPAGTRRVVCLGDSVTLGYGLRREQSYPSRLEALLQQRGPGVEVMTVALMGWATRQERIAYERIARRYAPDLVLLGICLNDLQDLQNNLARPPTWLARLHERSALVRRVVDAEGRQIRSVRDLVLDPEARRVREGYRRLFDEVRRLREAVERDGAAFALVLFPFADQVRPRPLAATPQRRIEAFCAREGIEVLDLLPELRALGEAAFVPGDHLHLSAEGCARTASRIASSGLVPAQWASSAALAQALGRAAPLVPRPEDVPRLAGLLTREEPQVRREAAWALGRVGSAARPAWRPLAAALEDPSVAVRLEAARALGRLRAAEARPALFGAAADPRQAVRWAAVETLAATGLEPPTDAPRLVALLASPDPYVRAFAAWELGVMGGVAGWAALALARRLEDVEPGVRAVAATAIGRLGNGDPAVVAALGRALQDPSWSGRWRAARALGLLGSASAVPSLTTALGDADERVRRESAKALGRLGSAAEAALPALVAARRDASQGVREAARAAIERLTDQ